MNLRDVVGQLSEKGTDYGIALAFHVEAINSYLKNPYGEADDQVGPGQATAHSRTITRIFGALKLAQQELLSFCKKNKIYSYWRWIYQEGALTGQSGSATMIALDSSRWPFRGATASSQSPNLNSVILGEQSDAQLTVHQNPPIKLLTSLSSQDIRSASWLGPKLTEYNKMNAGGIFILESKSEEARRLGNVLIETPKSLQEERRLGASQEISLVNRRARVALAIFPHSALKQNVRYDIELSITGINEDIWKDFTSTDHLGWFNSPTNLKNRLMLSKPQSELLIEYTLRQYQSSSQGQEVPPLAIKRINDLEANIVKAKRRGFT